MKKILPAVLTWGACVVLPAVAAAEGTSQEDIKKELEAMRTQLAAQMEKIAALERKLEKIEKEEVVGKVEGKVALANEFIDQLTLKSDLRVRYEQRSVDYYDQAATSDKNRDRWMTRFRLGLVWDNKKENWQVGAGLITGGKGATSSNNTWSQDSAFETGNISLDYAYAKHKWEDFTFTLGQAPNPYETAWVMWDGAVRFAGLTAQYGKKSGPFTTLGGYGAKLDDDDNTAMLYIGQAGYRGEVGDVSYTLAAGYQTYDQSFINDMPTHKDSKGNFLYNINADEYGLDIGDLYGKVSFPAGSARLSLYGQIWQNFGADGDVGESQIKSFPKKPEDADTGWAVGANTKIGKFYLGLDYSVIEADSLYGFLAEANFGDGLSGTNKKGYRVLVGYDFTKNWSTLISYFNYKQEEDFYDADNSKVDSVGQLQVDANYKF